MRFESGCCRDGAVDADSGMRYLGSAAGHGLDVLLGGDGMALGGAFIFATPVLLIRVPCCDPAEAGAGRKLELDDDAAEKDMT